MSTPESHTQAEKFFDRIAEDYLRRSEGDIWNVSSLSFARRQEIVTRLLDLIPSGGTILDYGMGPAVFGPAAVDRKLNYIGIDISKRMIDLAKEKNLPNARYYQGDLSVLDSLRGSADCVLLIGLIDYLEDPTAGLTALAHCVKPGGSMILSFRNRRSIPRLLRDAAKAGYRTRKSDQIGSDRAFSAPVLERAFVPQRDFVPLLRELGFREFSTYYLDASPIFWRMPLPRWVWHAWKRADGLISGRWTSFMCASGVLLVSGKI